MLPHAIEKDIELFLSESLHVIPYEERHTEAEKPPKGWKGWALVNTAPPQASLVSHIPNFPKKQTRSGIHFG